MISAETTYSKIWEVAEDEITLHKTGTGYEQCWYMCLLKDMLWALKGSFNIYIRKLYCKFPEFKERKALNYSPICYSLYLITHYFVIWRICIVMYTFTFICFHIDQFTYSFTPGCLVLCMHCSSPAKEPKLHPEMRLRSTASIWLQSLALLPTTLHVFWQVYQPLMMTISM